MLAGIRTRDLRKVYTSPPPVAAATGGFSFRAPKNKTKGPKPEIVALNGISLDIFPGISWLAVEKVVSGALQALAAGLMVIPAAWLLLRPGVELNVAHPLLFAGVALLVAIFSATGGLALGCSIEQNHIGLMFSLVVAPMIFFGCTYYPWSALKNFPIMQKAVLVNPLVYASEGLRGTIVPQFQHLPLSAVFVALVFFNILLLSTGLRKFHGKAVS